MDQDKFSSAREQLLRMRRDITLEMKNSSEASRELGQDGVPDIGDMAFTSYHRDVLMNFSENQRQKIRDIDVALERISSGEYGICIECEEEIASKRMEVRPFSRYCVECKSDVEKYGE